MISGLFDKLFSGLISGLIIPLINSVKRSVYNLDGVDDRATLQFRAINPDGDIRIKFRTGSTVPPAGQNYVIISQMISSAFANREFMLQTNTSNALQLLVGGIFSSNSGTPIAPNSLYEVSLIGNLFTVVCNGVTQISVTFNRGTSREPTAVTAIASRVSNGVSTWGFFYQGPLFDIEINGALWPMGGRNQAIQLPYPSGLGLELITQSVLENPNLQGSQWTYLGGGRWQLVGNGDINDLRFLTNPQHPAAGLLEFEIESISGEIRCTSGSIARAVFNTIGVKRYFYTSIDEGGAGNAAVVFRRNVPGVPASCIIKNISFRPLWVAGSTELVTNGDFSNGTTGWAADNGTISVVSGQGVLTTTAGQNSQFAQTLSVGAGVYYEISCDLVALSGVTSATLNFRRGAAGGFTTIFETSRASAGRMTFIAMATGTDVMVQIRGDGTNAGTVTVDNISVRKLDSLCNPMTLVNTNPDRWQEIDV